MQRMILGFEELVFAHPGRSKADAQSPDIFMNVLLFISAYILDMIWTHPSYCRIEGLRKLFKYPKTPLGLQTSDMNHPYPFS
jgi:hypothetical protein